MRSFPMSFGSNVVIACVTKIYLQLHMCVYIQCSSHMHYGWNGGGLEIVAIFSHSN